jgi:hypothetical protein
MKNKEWMNKVMTAAATDAEEKIEKTEPVETKEPFVEVKEQQKQEEKEESDSEKEKIELADI